MKEQEVTTTNKTFPIALAVLGLIYGISPVDILPDIVPVLGWVDDLVITGGAILNVAQSFANDSNRFFAQLLGAIKWVVWILGGILIAILALLGTAIYAIFAS
jgi:hypothetical protein